MDRSRGNLICADKFQPTRREDLDDHQTLKSARLTNGPLSVARFRRDRPGLGLTHPNALEPVLMVATVLMPQPAYEMAQNGKNFQFSHQEAGSIACLDMRDGWVADLHFPFDTVNSFIPLTAFDEITGPLNCARIEGLDLLVEQSDPVMKGLVSSLCPAFSAPSQVMSLFTDHILSAIVAHLAFTYGGLKHLQSRADTLHRGRLAPFQEHRVKSLLLDNIRADHSLDELAKLCGLSRGHFARAFRQTTGLPPHRWLLAQRVRRAQELLRRGDMPIGEVALECGFADQPHLTRVFSRAVGTSPAAWRRQKRE